ncbi:MAG: hypothetical protein ACNA7J_00040 [Wenzhouxiangella sp.]
MFAQALTSFLTDDASAGPTDDKAAGMALRAAMGAALRVVALGVVIKRKVDTFASPKHFPA